MQGGKAIGLVVVVVVVVVVSTKIAISKHNKSVGFDEKLASVCFKLRDTRASQIVLFC